MSLMKVAVSFPRTIKAMEPFFSVVLFAMFLGEVVSSLLPIVGGVALASVTETSFNCEMASNLTNQSRNVLSKKIIVNKDSLDNITLFSIFMEGVKFTPAYLQSSGFNVQQVYMRSLLPALYFHAYQHIPDELLPYHQYSISNRYHTNNDDLFAHLVSS